jgi:hypothetical protein
MLPVPVAALATQLLVQQLALVVHGSPIVKVPALQPAGQRQQQQHVIS